MIDEKGRLFGKINIVDLLVILVVLIAAVVLGLKFLKPNLAGGELENVDGMTPVTYTVLVENVLPEVYESVQQYLPGTLMASGEMLNGQIVDVQAETHYNDFMVETENGPELIEVDQGRLDLTFTIQCNVENPVTTLIGTQEVRVGKTHIVKTDKFEMVGTILTCEWGAEAAASAENEAE